MLKQIAWNTFKNTGDINTFMELVEVDKAINNVENLQKNNGLNIQNNQVKQKVDLNSKITL